MEKRLQAGKNNGEKGKREKGEKENLFFRLLDS